MIRLGLRAAVAACAPVLAIGPAHATDFKPLTEQDLKDAQ